MFDGLGWGCNWIIKVWKYRWQEGGKESKGRHLMKGD